MRTAARESGPARRARAEQIATLFGQWSRTTSSMTLGGLILCVVMWNTAPHGQLAIWLAAILLNQAWRHELVRRYRAASPQPEKCEHWGRAWTVGFDHRRRPLGSRRTALVRTGRHRPPGTADRLSLRRHHGGHQPHFGLQADDVRIRAARADATHRPRCPGRR